MKGKLGIARPVAPAAAGDSEATDGHCGLLLAERPSLHRNHLVQHRESLKQGPGLSQSDRTHGDLTRGSTVWVVPGQDRLALGPSSSAPLVTAEAGRRKQEAFGLGDGDDGAGIGGGIHLELEGGIGVDFGEESNQLGF